MSHLTANELLQGFLRVQAQVNDAHLREVIGYDVDAMKENNTVDENLEALEDALSNISTVCPYAIGGHVRL